MKLTIVGGGGFRVPLVYGALLEKAERLGLDEVVLHDIDAERLERIGHVLDGLAAEHGVAAAVPRHDRPRRRRRGRRLRVLRDPRRPARGPRDRRGRPARARRARPGDDRAGRHLLRAAHDPGDGAARRDDAPSTRPNALADQLHQPGRDGHRGASSRCSATAPSASATRRRACAGASPRRSGATPRELWFDYFGLNHLGWLRGVRDGTRRAAARRRCSTTTRGSSGFEEGRLFGGEWLRSLGMIPNEYLYYFYYAADTVNAIRGRQPARRVPARAAARVLRPQRRIARGGAGRLARHPPRPRAHLHGRGAQRRRATSPSTTSTRTPATRARRWRCSRRSRSTARAGADPQHREPLRAAVPGRARGGRGAVRRRPRRARPDGDGRGARRTRASLVETMKDVERTTIDAALTRLARARDQGARAAPARAVGDHRARDLRRLPRAAARAAGGVRVTRRPRLRRARLPRPDDGRAGRRSRARARSAWPTDFLRSPGGGAITAVGAARLGLVERARVPARRRRASACCCARCSPTTACAGTGGSCERTPVTVIMPTDGDRAMATFDPGESVTAAELAAVEPRAVVLSIPRLPLAPAGARVYVSVGDLDARALAGGELPGL